MNRRTSPPTSDGSPAYQRIMQKMEEKDAAMTDRMEAAFSRLDSRLDRIDRDLARGEQDRSRLQGEVAGLKIDLGELRDAANLGVVRAADAVASKTVPVVANTLPKTPWGRLLMIATAFTTLMVALNNIPDAARGWDRFWAFLKNDDRGVIEAKREDVK